MRGASAGKSLAKGVLSLNGASVVRALRLGPRAGLQSLYEAYHAVDPFSTVEKGTEALQRIPKVIAGEAFLWPPEIKVDLHFADISGSTPIRDLMVILALAIHQQPKAALEFGTFYGSTTKNLANNLPDATIHTIDLPPDSKQAQDIIKDRPVDDLHLIESRQLGKAFRDTPFSSRIVQHEGDTATYDYSIIRDEVSFFLVDGSHTYEYAKNDTIKAFSVSSTFSTIAWHDCDDTHPGVTRWLGELIDAGLQVQRVRDTVVAFMTFDPGDKRIQKVIQRS